MVKIGEAELELQKRPAPVIVAVMKRLDIHDAKRAKESGADILELRIDLLEAEEKSVAKVKEFVAMLKNPQSSVQMPIIITNRRKEEGGAFRGTEAERIGMLSDIIETAAAEEELVDAVDIEFFSPAAGKREILKKAKHRHIPVISSFHDFNGMPPAKIY